MNRTKKNIRISLILSVFLLLSYQFTFLSVEAEQPLKIVDGVYQVDLSFQSLEVGEVGAFFGEQATLAVEKGQYTLSLPINDTHMMTLLSVEQLGKHTPFLVNKNENLVEFDVLDLQQAVGLQGTVQLQENQIIPFKKRLTIDTKSLPKIEQPEPKPEPKPEPEPDLKPGPKPEPKPEKPPIEKPDEVPAKPELPSIEKQEEVYLEFLLVVDGKKEPSVMNTYIDPIAKVLKVGNHYEVQIKLIKAAWITGLKVEKNGEMIEPETISLENNIRTIRFHVSSLGKAKLMWVKVDIPEINYHHDYKVQLIFDENQVDQLIGQTTKPKKPSKSGNMRPGEQQEAITEKLEKGPTKTLEKSTVVLPEAVREGPVLSAPPVSIKANTKLPELEEKLAFDRFFDTSTNEEVVVADESASEEKESPTKHQPVNPDIQLSTTDKIKISLLVLVLLVSGYLLIRRMKRVKKSEISE